MTRSHECAACRNQIHIEQFSKTPEGNWLLRESDNEDGILNLASANCQIPHRQIYERVQFENQSE
jgi:hypothetical protein